MHIASKTSVELSLIFREPNLLAAPNCIEYSFALADWVIEAS